MKSPRSTAPRPAAAELVGRAACESLDGRVGAVELRPIAVGLLEVVADDLVALDELVPGEPVGEALVQLGACRLRQRLVRRVADEEMPKAEALVLGKGRARRADQLLADERGEVRLDDVAHGGWRQLGDRTPVEHLALDRATLHHDAHVAVERVDACLEERLDRRRNGDLTVAAVLANHRQHLFDVERVSGRRRGDLLPQLGAQRGVADEAPHQLLALRCPERLEEERRRVELPAAPGGSRVEQLRARDTEEKDRRVA